MGGEGEFATFLPTPRCPRAPHLREEPRVERCCRGSVGAVDEARDEGPQQRVNKAVVLEAPPGDAAQVQRRAVLRLGVVGDRRRVVAEAVTAVADGHGARLAVRVACYHNGDGVPARGRGEPAAVPDELQVEDRGQVGGEDQIRVATCRPRT